MEKKSNLGKIIAIVAGVTVGLCAVSFFISKLLQKYFVLKDTEYNDLMEGNEEEASDVVVDHAEEDAEEAEEKEEDAPAEEK